MMSKLLSLTILLAGAYATSQSSSDFAEKHYSADFKKVYEELHDLKEVRIENGIYIRDDEFDNAVRHQLGTLKKKYSKLLPSSRRDFMKSDPRESPASSDVIIPLLKCVGIWEPKETFEFLNKDDTELIPAHRLYAYIECNDTGSGCFIWARKVENWRDDCKILKFNYTCASKQAMREAFADVYAEVEKANFKSKTPTSVQAIQYWQQANVLAVPPKNREDNTFPETEDEIMERLSKPSVKQDGSRIPSFASEDFGYAVYLLDNIDEKVRYVQTWQHYSPEPSLVDMGDFMGDKNSSFGHSSGFGGGYGSDYGGGYGGGFGLSGYRSTSQNQEDHDHTCF